MTAVAYVNKQGGTKSKKLNDIANAISRFCEERTIALSAVHLPGNQNTIADQASRSRSDMSDWKLSDRAFSSIMRRWFINFDLFASYWNRQTSRYASWRPQPSAEVVNAFSFSWSSVSGYAFPPFALIPRCLEKIRREKTHLVLVTPIWPNQAWYPLLLEMLSDFPIFLHTDQLERSQSERSSNRQL